MTVRMIQKFVQVEANAAGLTERQIRVVASDATVDRVDDIMVPEGCDLSDYRNNPIVLAQHNPDHPIGNADVEVKDGKVVALITFAPAGISHKADEYCALYKSGVMRTVSVGFDPVEAEPIKGGGFRYVKWKLLELSCVSVPANPNATTLERSAEGAQRAKAKAEWKVGASRNLPIDEDSAWDGPAAQKAIFAHCDFDGDKPDTALARKAFLAYDASAPEKKGSYKLPFATVKDGRLTAVAAGIRAAASRLPDTDIPDDVMEKARAVIDHYEGKMKGKSIRGIRIKGLYDVAQLSYALENLGCIHDRAKWEAEIEQDASKLPQMLADAMRQVADALVAMTAEEVNELLTGRDIEPLPIDLDYVELAATPQAKNLRAAFRKAGRVMSQENVDHVTAVHKCMKAIGDCLQKAADLHDDVHAELEQMMEHGTSAGDHLKALMESAGVDENGDDQGEDDKPAKPGKRKPAAADEEDPDDGADNELSAEASQRKRAAAVLALEAPAV